MLLASMPESASLVGFSWSCFTLSAKGCRWRLFEKFSAQDLGSSIPRSGRKTTNTMLRFKQWSWDIRSETAKLPIPEYVHMVRSTATSANRIYIVFLGYFNFYVLNNG